MNRKIKTENKKALPKFLGIILIAMVFGGLVGFAMGFTSFLGTPVDITNKIYEILDFILPYSNWAITGFFKIVNIILFKQAKSMYENWNGFIRNNYIYSAKSC